MSVYSHPSTNLSSHDLTTDLHATGMSSTASLHPTYLSFADGGDVQVKLDATENVLTLSGNSGTSVRVVGVADPTGDADAATKSYVDAQSIPVTFDGTALRVPEIIRPTAATGDLLFTGQGDISIAVEQNAASTGGNVEIASGLAADGGTNGDVSIIASSNDESAHGDVYISSHGVNYRWPDATTANQTFSVMVISGGGESQEPTLSFSRDVSLGLGYFSGNLDSVGRFRAHSGVLCEGPEGLKVYESAVIGNSSLDSSAVLALDSTSQGLLPPRMTSAQRDGISSPTEGLVVYDTTEDHLYLRANSAWNALSISAYSRPESTLDYDGTYTNTTPEDFTWDGKTDTNGGIPWVSGSNVLVQCVAGRSYQVKVVMRPGVSNTHIAFQGENGNGDYIPYSYLVLEAANTNGGLYGSTMEKTFTFRASGATDAENQLKLVLAHDNGATSVRITGMYMVIREM